MKLCSFDIETATVTPENADPHQFRPLGICCAATQLVDTDLGSMGIQTAMAWANFSDGAPDPDVEMYGAKMSSVQICSLVDYLSRMQAGGYVPLTWNGLGFDFDILAEEAVAAEFSQDCANLAVGHYDVAFQMLCNKGFMVGMQAAALGLGLHGKSEGMHGDLAPVLWAESRAAQDKVLEYVKQDVQTTSEIALQLIEKKALRWTSKSGRPNVWRLSRLLTVREALALPTPDTSWMSLARTRESCYIWTKKYLGEEEWTAIKSIQVS